MIKHVANPFFIAFIVPFLFVTALVFVQFQVYQFEFVLIKKQIVIPSGYERLTLFAELFYDGIGSVPFGEQLQQAWIIQYAEGKRYVQRLFAFWIAVHVGAVVGIAFCSKRWVVMYFTRQYEKQSLLSDRKLMK